MAKRRKLKYQDAGQCKDCTVKYCAVTVKEQCAKAEFTAIAAGTVYDCPDREAPYWETMCA